MTEQAAWEHRAACSRFTSDLDLFFDPLYEVDVRRGLCSRCEVAWECFEFGRTNHMYGIWGGVFMNGKMLGRRVRRMTKELHAKLLKTDRRRIRVT